MTKFSKYEELTLNSIHCNRIIEYNKDDLLVSKKQKKLQITKDKLSKLRQKMENPGYISSSSDDDLLDKLLDETENLEIDIQKLESKTDMLNYLNDTKQVISKYYEDQSIKVNSNIENLTSKAINKISKKKFAKQKKKYEFAVDLRTYFDKNNTKKVNYLEDYINIVDDSELLSQKKNAETLIMCDYCNIEKIIMTSEGSAVCTNCGDVEFVIIEPDKYPSKETVSQKKSHTYQRINHFKERLSQFQEPCIVKPEHYEKIIKELKYQGYTDFSVLIEPYIQIDLMRKILKKLGLNSYYKYCAHIICVITNTEVPEITHELKLILIKMFELIQQPFEKHKPSNRINFLSYSYVFFKFLELLNLNKLKQSFTLLKSEKKLREQDEVWRKICTELNWPFKYSPVGRGRYISQLKWI